MSLGRDGRRLVMTKLTKFGEWDTQRNKNLYSWPLNCQRSGNLEETQIMGGKVLVTSKLNLHPQQLFSTMP